MFPGLFFTAVLPRRSCQLCHSFDDGVRCLDCCVSPSALTQDGSSGAEAVCLSSHGHKPIQQACDLVRCGRFRGLDGCPGRGSSSYLFGGARRCVCSIAALIAVSAGSALINASARSSLVAVYAQLVITTVPAQSMASLQRIMTLQRTPHRRNGGSEVVLSLSHSQRRSSVGRTPNVLSLAGASSRDQDARMSLVLRASSALPYMPAMPLIP
ncbi:hypothetical protein CERZMDRAFT_81177 [Cercospora zeae-maydis SCOH1-5]|uniref:Uncharacterized protein n=1 Tax=Cercospora zeae-maydis SCOH1-5 TaxID=717836 RepID=A0A6A6FVH4_9PEZI|nr:hypothetical protein CERZMDRAFT_81177 [Cercospora zeae-maydis SCOH1-5]